MSSRRTRDISSKDRLCSTGREVGATQDYPFGETKARRSPRQTTQKEEVRPASNSATQQKRQFLAKRLKELRLHLKNRESVEASLQEEKQSLVSNAGSSSK